MKDNDTVLLEAIGEVLKQERAEIDARIAAVANKTDGPRHVAIKEIALCRDELHHYIDQRMHRSGSTIKGLTALNLPAWTKGLHRG